MLKFKDLVGHRIILNRGACGHKDYVEVIVLEMSPSGKRVKFKYPSDHESWEEIYEDEYFNSTSNKQILEDLGLVKISKRNKNKK
jgi:hypothetical protein